MLRELRDVRQVPGEPKRRWFFCHDVDLVVFEDDDGICGFQLAYDKHRQERSLAWTRGRGFAHYVVDDGEPSAGVNSTPFLYTDGPFQRDRVLAQFLALTAEVPADIARFVEAKLRAYEAPTRA